MEPRLWFLQLRLRRLRGRRRHLIRILHEDKEMRRNYKSIASLRRQGRDGSALVNQDSGEPAGPELPSAAPEVRELLQVEDKIRQCLHSMRIRRARIAASQHQQRLGWLRKHPLQRLAVRTLQALGTVELVGPVLIVVWDKLLGGGQRSSRHVTQVAPPQDLPDVENAKVATRGGALSPKRVMEQVQFFIDLTMQYFALRTIQRRLMPAKLSMDMRTPDVSIDQVVGIGGAKAEALEIIECLIAPARFHSLGAKCPKGLLLTGPPGCGKTMMAKAIAASAAVPFISRSGADFNHRFAGHGSMMVKEIFATARANAPAVVLIDEIDYLGRRRSEERGGGLETDRAAALTQLLAEMDGFRPLEGVVVIGTTNRADILDKALLRPGRFDRHVRIPLPDVEGRLKILSIHAGKLLLETDIADHSLTGPRRQGGPDRVDWKAWAKRTPGFSGADLAGLINEAAMAAAREGAIGVGERHMQTAYSKALIGVPSGRHRSKPEMALTAAHEAGHAVVNEAVGKALSMARNGTAHRTVAYISIVPAGHTGGVTQFTEPDEERRPPENKRAMLAQLAVAMAGRAAEELGEGRGQATMGATDDFRVATEMATRMVTAAGLSDAIGPRVVGVGMPPSEDTRRRVDLEVNRILRSAMATARSALERNRALHAAVTDALIERETLDGEAFREILAKHPVVAAKL